MVETFQVRRYTDSITGLELSSCSFHVFDRIQNGQKIRVFQVAQGFKDLLTAPLDLSAISYVTLGVNSGLMVICLKKDDGGKYPHQLLFDFRLDQNARKAWNALKGNSNGWRSLGIATTIGPKYVHFSLRLLLELTSGFRESKELLFSDFQRLFCAAATAAHGVKGPTPSSATPGHKSVDEECKEVDPRSAAGHGVKNASVTSHTLSPVSSSVSSASGGDGNSKSQPGKDECSASLASRSSAPGHQGSISPSSPSLKRRRVDELQCPLAFVSGQLDHWKEVLQKARESVDTQAAEFKRLKEENQSLHEELQFKKEHAAKVDGEILALKKEKTVLENDLAAVNSREAVLKTDTKALTWIANNCVSITDVDTFLSEVRADKSYRDAFLAATLKN
jgi:hypothetical protein